MPIVVRRVSASREDVASHCDKPQQMPVAEAFHLFFRGCLAVGVCLFRGGYVLFCLVGNSICYSRQRNEKCLYHLLVTVSKTRC